MPRSNQKIMRSCWCGHDQLDEFSPDYRLCSACGTLVSQVGFADADYLVQNDESDFYGKKYWLEHQPYDLGLPQIDERARLDLPERCIHWLRQILKYRLPPARVLELGASHGAFVALMNWAGFQATGLELSPWVAEYARRTFEVPMLVGPLEQQPLSPGSLDIVVANDVMEHLPDPIGTIRTAVNLLKPDGMLVLQMPDFVEGKSYAQRVESNERFLDHVRKPAEHLYLYSQRAARLLLSRAGLGNLEFRPAIFDYDMYLLASRQPLKARTDEEITSALQRSPRGRWTLAFMDKADAFDRMCAAWRESESDRMSRLHFMTCLGEQLAASDADRAARLESVMSLTKSLTVCETERAAAMETVWRQEQIIKDCKATIESLRMALCLQPYPPMRVRVTRSCVRAAKGLARAVLPLGWRRRFRQIVPIKTEESAGGTRTRAKCVGS